MEIVLESVFFAEVFCQKKIETVLTNSFSNFNFLDQSSFFRPQGAISHLEIKESIMFSNVFTYRFWHRTNIGDGWSQIVYYWTYTCRKDKGHKNSHFQFMEYKNSAWKLISEVSDIKGEIFCKEE